MYVEIREISFNNLPLQIWFITSTAQFKVFIGSGNISRPEIVWWEQDELPISKRSV